MTTVAGTLAERYATSLEAYIREPSEAVLSGAYDLGRSAVREGMSVLDLAAAHNAALVAAFSPGGAARDPVTAATAAGDFFLEALSSYAMVQRVLQDTREAAAVERRQAMLLRRLSTFLGDASIAIDAATSLEEMLQLVAEHAREMVDASGCVVRVMMRGADDVSVRVVAHAGDEGATQAAHELEALFPAVAAPGRAVRMSRADLESNAARRALAGGGDPSADGWLAVSLSALDGSDLGLIQVFDKQDGGQFSELDEAVIVQLAQMASAAVERTQLYRQRA